MNKLRITNVKISRSFKNQTCTAGHRANIATIPPVLATESGGRVIEVER